MKSYIKTLALSALISPLALCVTLSTASAETSQAQISQDFPVATYMLAFPKLTNEGSAKKRHLLTPGNEVTEFEACKSTTKNEYFELATLLNDKLQHLISALSNDDEHTSNDSQLSQVTTIK